RRRRAQALRDRADENAADKLHGALPRTSVPRERRERLGLQRVDAFAQAPQHGIVRFGLEQPGELRLVTADHTRAHHTDVPHAPALTVPHHGEVERHARAIGLDYLRLHDGAVAVHRITGDDDLLTLVTVEALEILAIQQLAEEGDVRTPLDLAKRLPVRAMRTAAILVPFA